jgi:4-hydroxy-tetrahydrodipicolinate reductase
MVQAKTAERVSPGGADGQPTNVVSLGLGPIGLAIANAVLQKEKIALVGAVDSNQALAGRPLSEMTSTADDDLIVEAGLDALLGRTSGTGVVVQATASRVEAILPQLETIFAHGWNVVSTSEELANPELANPELASRIDQLAREADATVLGAGINPGFLMDVLPLVLTGICLDVESVAVRRVVDTNLRRIQLQEKVGVGLQQEEFEERAASGNLGHVGLRQSAYLIANKLGWEVEEYTEKLSPVLADHDSESPIATIHPGEALGQHQVGSVWSSGRERVRLELEMYAGAAAEDRIEIVGLPPIQQVIPGGVNGDLGTAAIISNLVPLVADAKPGLLTIADILPVAWSPSRTAN